MESDDLEREAVALVARYGLLMPGAVKEFLKKMASHLGWPNLERKLK